LRLNSDGRDTIEKIHLLSGLSKADIKTFFESLFTLVVLDYLETDDTYLPFLGSLSIDYIDEEYNSDSKTANLEVTINSDPDLKLNIGQIKDQDVTSIEKLFQRKIEDTLTEYLV